ncbi:MAG: DUF4199 domain-containing protein [Rikenellaceae bacterium]
MNNNYKELANSAAKWGLIVGVLMSASRIYESSVMVSGDASSYVLVSFEWIFSSALFVYLLLRANKQRANATPSEVGYGVRQVVNYTLVISIFASVIVAISSHIYISNVVGGYGLYAERSIESISRVLDEAQVGAEGEQIVEQSLLAAEDIKSNPPTIFTTIFSMVANYIIGAFLTSLIIVWFVRRRPVMPSEERPTDMDNNKDDEDE